MNAQTVAERIARVEANLSHVCVRLDHLDICLDSIKKVIWVAVGGFAVISFVGQLVIAKLFN